MERTDRAADAGGLAYEPRGGGDRCPVCGATGVRRWVDGAADRLHGTTNRRFAYDRCSRCRSVHLADRLTTAELDAAYPPAYAPHLPGTGAAAAVGIPGTRASALARALGPVAFRAAALADRSAPDPLPAALDSMLRPAASGERFLDHGCGTSDVLREAAERGWRPVGSDLSPAVLDSIRREGFESVAAGDLEASLAPGSLGAVRMNHVLEHVADPRELLARLRRLLRSGGRLHAALPNPEGPSARVFGADWFSLDCPRHLVLPAPRALAELALEVGFREVRILHERTTKDLARSYGYRLASRGSISTEQALQLQNDQDLARLVRPIAVAAAAAGRGDRYHLFARA